MTNKSTFSEKNSSIPSSTKSSALLPLSSTTVTIPTSLSLPFITAYGPKTKVTESYPAEGRTKQSFKNECDINQIMARYQKTGVLDFTAKHAPQYGDATGLEFREGLDVLQRAREMFADLPAKLRAQFNNDPGEFLDFVHNPENVEEMRQMGLLMPEPSQATPLAASAAGSGSGAQKPPTGASVASEGEEGKLPKK